MGWSYGWTTRKALVAHLLDGSGHPSLTVLRKAETGYGHRLWVAFEHKDPTKAPQGQTRFVALFLINGSDLGGNGKMAQHGWGYKDMSEESGPYDVDCPLTVLDAAGPDSAATGYAAEWRQNVRAYHAARSASRAKAKALKPGDKIRIAGTKDNPFTVTSVKPFRGYGASGLRYRLPSSRPFEVLEAANA
ncbi:MAG: hypothetical protein MUF54_01505 [Polyangiaceae bacterium]|nr:hypothetical protein [Polyangiaceae bacterium]